MEKEIEKLELHIVRLEESLSIFVVSIMQIDNGERN